MNDVVAELAGLRRRAYGPDADITADPAALERLVELEGALREVRSPVESVVPVESVEPVAPVVAVTAKRMRVSGHPGISVGIALGIAAVAGLIFALGVPNVAPAANPSPAPSDERFGDASAFGGDPGSRILRAIPIGGSFGDSTAGAGGAAEPPFPVAEGLGWSASIGTYYGWELWLARSRSGLPCVALARAQETRAKCLLPGGVETAGLVVSVPYASVPPEDRPDGMSPGESIGYLWLSDRTVSIVVGRASNDSAIIGRRR